MVAQCSPPYRRTAQKGDVAGLVAEVPAALPHLEPGINHVPWHPGPPGEQVMGEGEALREAVAWLGANATFDVDARVHVFELTIRAVGSLLSAHMLIEQVRTQGGRRARAGSWLSTGVAAGAGRLARRGCLQVLPTAAASRPPHAPAVPTRLAPLCRARCPARCPARTRAWCPGTMAACCAWPWTSPTASCPHSKRPPACRCPGSTCARWCCWGGGAWGGACARLRMRVAPALRAP